MTVMWFAARKEDCMDKTICSAVWLTPSLYDLVLNLATGCFAAWMQAQKLARA